LQSRVAVRREIRRGLAFHKRAGNDGRRHTWRDAGTKGLTGVHFGKENMARRGVARRRTSESPPDLRA
jgi:hypothetical protein